MSAELKELVNSPFLWVITIGGLCLVFGLALLFIIRSIQAAPHVGVTKEQVNTTLKTACVSAIGPSIVIAVGMISLLVVAGAPTALLRLSVCGNVGYEVQAVGVAAGQFGADGTAASLTGEIFQTAVFIAALGCIGYLIVPVLFVTKFDKVIQKVGGKDMTMMMVICNAAILGCYAYVDAPYILRQDNSTVALIVGFVVILAVQQFVKKTGKKTLLQWNLLISMLCGMLAGALAG